MSKSSIKTKTVLTMTDMIESTELQAFKRQKDGYKVTVKISSCICVVLSIGITFCQEPRFSVLFSPPPFIS